MRTLYDKVSQAALGGQGAFGVRAKKCSKLCRTAPRPPTRPWVDAVLGSYAPHPKIVIMEGFAAFFRPRGEVSNPA